MRVDSSVGGDGFDGGSSFGCPVPERGDVQVEPTLVDEPEPLVGERVHALRIVLALVCDVVVKDHSKLRGNLLVAQPQLLGRNPPDR